MADRVKQPTVIPAKKRKIQPIFLGTLDGGTTLTTTTISTNSVAVEEDKIASNSAIPSTATAAPPSAPAPLTNGSVSQQPTCSSSSPLRVNSRLIGRLDDDASASGHGPKNHLQNCGAPAVAPSTSKMEPMDLADGGENSRLNNNESSLSMHSWCSFEANTSTNTNNYSEQRPLPELRSDGHANLRPLPQLTNLQNLAKVRLPTPQAQKDLEQRIQLTPECRVDRVLVQNALLNKRTLKGTWVQAKLGRESKWSHMLSSPVLLLCANSSWTVVTHEDNSLSAFHTPTGRHAFSVHTNGGPVAVLELRDNHCMALSTEAEMQVWDLRLSCSTLRTSIRALMLDYSTGTHQIVRAYVNANGVPVLVLNSGDVFIYAKSLQSWLHLHIGPDFPLSRLSSMHSIARAFPDGLMAVLAEASKRIELPKDPVAPQRMEMAAANEERQLEQLLRATRELSCWEEHRMFTSVYAQMLLVREKHSKFSEFLAELSALCQSPNDGAGSGLPFPFATILADLRPLTNRKGLDLEEMLRSRRADKADEAEDTLSRLLKSD